MKIRTRITLFVAGSGFVVSLLLSLWLIYELLEQPFRILQASLYEEAAKAVQIYNRGQIRRYEEGIGATSTIWLEIYGADTGHKLYTSPLARSVDLKLVRFEEENLVETILTSAFGNLRHNPNARRTYMAREFEIMDEGKKFQVRIASEMDQLEKLDEEIREIVWVVISSLLLAVLASVAIGRIVAEKILRPVERIRKLAQNISDKNLSERVPIGKDRDELGDLSETLNGMLDRLQHSFARQREFLFDTSHELKTPLTTMRLAIEELCTDGKYGLSEEAEESLLRMEAQVLRMERLVKDLLSLSALEALHKIDMKPVRVTGLLLLLADEYRLFAEARDIGIAIRAPEEFVIPGDEEKLRRAFSNILDNAIKYNEDGGSVEIDLSQSSDEPRVLAVVVANTGEGVPEKELTKVFEQFYRAEKSRSVQGGGAGLGLAIVKKIVELHGGSVAFESRPGGPNRLTMTFPFNERITGE